MGNMYMQSGAYLYGVTRVSYLSRLLLSVYVFYLQINNKIV